jgi:quercetin dioxygenase-like cupin family protein
MFAKHSENGYIAVIGGIRRKTLVHGDKTLMSEFLLDKETVLPKHSHPHEQTGYLVSGRIRLAIGNETRELFPGDSWCIAGGIEHGAEIIENAVAIEIFSPVREDYL